MMLSRLKNRLRAAACSSALALLCTTPLAAQTDAKLRKSEADTAAALARMLDLSRDPLKAFLAEPARPCSSDNLRQARVMAIGIVAAPVVQRLRLGEKREFGETLIAVADAARSAGCKEIARKMYDLVIATFEGSAFAALRQRAQIGIDDVRAMP